MSCIEEIYDTLVVGHALQMGHFCETQITEESLVLSAQENSNGEYRYSDYDYECGYRDQFLQLDDQTNYPGERLTCLTVVPLLNANILARIPPVSVHTDWRVEHHDDGLLEPACFTFLPAFGNDMTNISKTP